MKNLAKVLALVLALTMVMSTMAFAASPFADVAEDATYAEAVTMLSDLNILNGYEEEGGLFFKPDQTITRAEVAKVIVCALGATDAAAGASNLNTFSDVDATHWAAGYVNYIAGYNNIIAGYGDGTFGPSDPVLYEQVIKMIVCALGYYPMAMQRGGYPTGFLAVASELGLTKGATGSAGEPAKRWVVARAIYNALTVAMMKQTGWDINAPEYTITGTGDYEEETLLEDYLDVVKVNGIVSETFYQQGTVDKENLVVTIEGLSKEDAEAVNDDEDDRTLTIEVGNTEAELYHGYAVTAYIYTDEDDEQVLVAIAPRGTRNTVEAFALADMEADADANTTKGYVTVTFDDGDEDTDVKIASDAKIYVNLDEQDIDDEDDIIDIIARYADTDGTVTLIQNETSDKYADYVFVEYFNEASYVITSINASKAKVDYEKNNGSKGNDTLDADDDDMWVFFIKNGEEIDFDDLAEGDVISKVTNDADTVIKAYVSSDVVEGKISNVNTTKKTATIAGTKYDYKYVDLNGELGSTGIFYLDCNGDIVYFDKTEGATSNDDYAFLFVVAEEDDKWGSNTVVSMRVLDADGTWNEYDFAEKVTVKYGEDENKSADTDELLANFAAWTNGTIAYEDDAFTVNKGLIQYKLNTSNKVSTLIIPKSGATDEYLSYGAISADEFVEEDYTIGGLDIADDVVIFALADGSDDDEEDITVVSAASVFEDGEEYDGAYFISKDGDDSVPNAMVIDAEGTSVKSATRFFIVSEATECENAEGDAQAALVGYTNGSDELTTIFVADDATLADGEDAIDYDDLLEGDVVALTTDADGEICDLKVLITADEVLADTKGWVVEDEIDDEDVKEVYGFVAEAGTTTSGVGYFDLSEYAFDDDTDVDDVVMMDARIRENKLEGAVYYVDLSRKNIAFNVADGFADVLAGNVSFDKDGSTRNGGEGYYIYAKLVEDKIVDAVVFIVDCEGFDTDNYIVAE